VANQDVASLRRRLQFHEARRPLGIPPYDAAQMRGGEQVEFLFRCRPERAFELGQCRIDGSLGVRIGTRSLPRRTIRRCRFSVRGVDRVTAAGRGLNSARTITSRVRVPN
jgi:hypothetical protein